MVYTITGARNSYCDYAQRMSVLWPLSGSRPTKSEDVVSATELVLARWRARVHSLRALGWANAASQWSASCLCNCPPAGVHVTNQYDRKMRVCKLVGLCPWCTMRQVGGVYTRFAEVFDEEATLTNCGIHTLSVSNFLLIPTNSEDSLLTSVNDVYTACKQLLHRLIVKGTYSSISVSPTSVDAPNDHWAVRYNILGITPSEWIEPEWLNNGHRTVNRVHVATKKQLVRIIGNTCRYPAGLLLGSTSETLRAINAKRGRRSHEFSGCLRAKSGR